MCACSDFSNGVCQLVRSNSNGTKALSAQRSFISKAGAMDAGLGGTIPMNSQPHMDGGRQRMRFNLRAAQASIAVNTATEDSMQPRHVFHYMLIRPRRRRADAAPNLRIQKIMCAAAELAKVAPRAEGERHRSLLGVPAALATISYSSVAED